MENQKAEHGPKGISAVRLPPGTEWRFGKVSGKTPADSFAWVKPDRGELGDPGVSKDKAVLEVKRPKTGFFPGFNHAITDNV